MGGDNSSTPRPRRTTNTEKNKSTQSSIIKALPELSNDNIKVNIISINDTLDYLLDMISIIKIGNPFEKYIKNNSENNINECLYCNSFESKNKTSNEKVHIHCIDIGQLDKGSFQRIKYNLSMMKIFNKNKYSLKFIEAFKFENKIFIITEPYKNKLSHYLAKLNRKLELKEIYDIFSQINYALSYMKKKFPIISFNLSFDSILYSQKNGKIKIHVSNIPDCKLLLKENHNKKFINDDMEPPELFANNPNIKRFDRIDIWRLGLILYKLYDGKYFKYQKNLETLSEKIENEIIKVYKGCFSNISREDNLIRDLMVNCLNFDSVKRIDFNKYFTHPFFNNSFKFIRTGKIDDKTKKYEPNQDKDFLNITLININELFFDKLKIECFEDTEPFYENINVFNDKYKSQIQEQIDVNKFKELILYKTLNLNDKEEKNNIDSFISNISSIYDDKSLMPFIIFLNENLKELEEYINIKLNDKKIDRRFIFCLEYSDKNKILIKNSIYRAYSYFNDCGDVFELNDKKIDLRKNNFSCYYNIICIARSQTGKSSFINAFISSFNNEKYGVVRARQGGHGKSCTKKFAAYYLDDLPIKLIDVIGYDGKKETVDQLKKIVDEMSIIILQNEIQIILYLIEFNSSVLFMDSEVDIFETMQLNTIKPKFLIIRTKSTFNIYDENNNFDENLLSVNQKKKLKEKMVNLNNCFKTIKNDDNWKNVINFLFKDAGPDYFTHNNVCFVNLFDYIDDNDNEIKKFGMDHLKNKMVQNFELILKEQEFTLENLQKLLNDVSTNKIKDGSEIFKRFYLDNFYTEHQSPEDINNLTKLIDNNMKNRMIVNFVKEKPKMEIDFIDSILVCVTFYTFAYKLNQKKDSPIELTINELEIERVLESFVLYKVKLVSGLKILLEQFKNKNKDINNNIINNNIINEDNFSSLSDNNDEILNFSKDLIDDALISPYSVYTNLNGIKNNYYDCFIIATLQCLIHCPPFINKLFSLNEKNFKEITKEFYEICKEQTYKCTNSLLKFKNSIKNKSKENFCDSKMHDSMEFCRFLLENMCKELNKKNNIQNLENLNPIKKIDKYKLYLENYKKIENSFIDDIFYSKTINIFNCNECKNETYSFEPNLDLILTIQKNQKLEDALNEYFSKITVEKNCETCNKICEINKRILIAYTPEILTISLQRVKDDIDVEFNETIDLKYFIDGELCDKEHASYKLISVINYKLNNSNVSSGNEIYYYNNIKIENKWFDFKGNTCNELKNVNLKNSISYVLFYQKI